jgi:hypothetical protein
LRWKCRFRRGRTRFHTATDSRHQPGFQVDVPEDRFFLVGMADVTAGHNEVSGIPKPWLLTTISTERALGWTPLPYRESAANI